MGSTPSLFRCHQCRRTDGAWGPKSRKGWHTRVELTGKTKAKGLGRCSMRTSQASRQYRCLDCGHVGWSTHKELERMEENDG